MNVGTNNLDSFYEPPYPFNFIPKNGLEKDPYYQYIEDLTKNCLTWHDCIQTIIKELFNLQDFGTINISAEYFRRKKQYINSAISHEISHFIKFLIRINGLNYEYGLNYSRKDLDFTKLENYFSKPSEWKELAATYIEELCIMFDDINVEHNYQMAIKFINSIFRYCKIPYDNCFTFDEYEQLILQFNSEFFHKKEIMQFIKTTYENSKDNNSYRNTWKVFKKFIFNEFKHKYKDK